MIGTTQKHRSTARRFVIETVQTLLQAVLIFLVFTALIGRFVIHQTSMEPNFHEGQRVVVSKLGSIFPELLIDTAHAANETSSPFALHQGQIAVFYDNPEHQGDPLIKRVIGGPGDTIMIRDGVVFVNGTALDEPYLHTDTTNCETYCGPITLDDNMYFMMGDNRAVSRDSRSFGPVPIDRIVGRVILRYWPLDQIHLF